MTEMDEPTLLERLAMNLYGAAVSYHLARTESHPGPFSRCPRESCAHVRALLDEARAAVDGPAELWR